MFVECFIKLDLRLWAELSGVIHGGLSAPVKGKPLIFNLVLASLQGEPSLVFTARVVGHSLGIRWRFNKML